MKKIKMPQALIEHAKHFARNSRDLNRALERLVSLQKEKEAIEKDISFLNVEIEILAKQQQQYRDFLESIGENWKEDEQTNP